jgi:hypothetical protein
MRRAARRQPASAHAGQHDEHERCEREARGEENERGRVTQPQFGEDRAAAPQQDEQRRCAMRGERAFERNHVNSPVERIETFHAARRRAIRDTRARTACVTRADGKRNTGWSAGARRRWRRRGADERRCDRRRGADECAHACGRESSCGQDSAGADVSECIVSKCVRMRMNVKGTARRPSSATG